MATLKKRGAEFIGPDEGMLSCGYEGLGRLWPVDAVARRAVGAVAVGELRNRPAIAMNALRWHKAKWMPRILATPPPEPTQQAARILAIQRNIILPVRAVVTGVVFYFLFPSSLPDQQTSRGVVIETLGHYFIFYIIFNAIAAVLLTLRRFPFRFVQWVVFAVGLTDGVLLAGMATTTDPGGFQSALFWVFPGLIIINALSIPLATPQIVLNLSLCAFYLGAGLLSIKLNESDINPPDPFPHHVESATFQLGDIINPIFPGGQTQKSARQRQGIAIFVCPAFFGNPQSVVQL